MNVLRKQFTDINEKVNKKVREDILEYQREEIKQSLWMSEVGDWFGERCYSEPNNDYGINLPYESIVLDTINRYTLPKRFEDLEDVLFIEVRFSDNRKNIPSEIKQFVMDRIVYDMEKHYGNEIPFFYQKVGNVIRIFDITKVDSDGKKFVVEKEGVV